MDLPDRCLLRVLELTTPQALAAFSCCCQTTAQFCSDEELWRTVMIRNYGELVLPELELPAGVPQCICGVHSVRFSCTCTHIEL
jgi:hypothetical protein